ncbi:MAG TPA: hypothetical protein PKL88_01820 [bacterium]|nr:hypothetical protein [bacterium]
MEIPVKGGFGLVKKIFLYAFFIVELIILLTVALNFIDSEKYFSLAKNFAVPYVLVLIFLLFTVSLISQITKDKWEIFLPPAIIFLSSFIFLARFKILEALLGSVVLSLFFLCQQKRTDSLTKGVLKINISHSARPVTKGLLLTISAVISVAVYLNSNNAIAIDIGKWAADIVEKPIEDAIKKEAEKELPENINNINLQSLRESNPKIFSVLSSFGINDLPIKIPASENISENIAGTIKKSISDQVNKSIEPYRKFFGPTLALLVFGMLQIYHTIAYFIYSSLSPLFLLLLRKLKFIRIEKIPTEQEIFKL